MFSNNLFSNISEVWLYSVWVKYLGKSHWRLGLLGDGKVKEKSSQHCLKNAQCPQYGILYILSQFFIALNSRWYCKFKKFPLKKIKKLTHKISNCAAPYKSGTICHKQLISGNKAFLKAYMVDTPHSLFLTSFNNIQIIFNCMDKIV